jgi:LmbE family N-acetylglucosaminyl deacetylase
MTFGAGTIRSATVIVAHPDDETLWAGGTMLLHPAWQWRIVTLCRAGDPDRAPRFHRVLAHLGATGAMADLDDGPEQRPLSEGEVQRTALELVGAGPHDLLLTHSPQGEYTRHRRHEEVGRAVAALWRTGRLRARELWLFAYQDGGGSYLPRAVEQADLKLTLPPAAWEEKRRMVRELYGFAEESWEMRVAPALESFWCFGSPERLAGWLAPRRRTNA